MVGTDGGGMMRWRPSRAGIFNIWEYDDQVFEFGDGRLVLRGRNGSGKSNALALLFPFLLDGVMSSARMDPMGGARSMKSLLLGRDDESATGRYRHEAGTGYVWMEFVACAGMGVDLESGWDGDEIEFVTIGVGASATQQRDADSWFFVTSQRVGFDLRLDDEQVPKSRRRLAESLDDGEVLTTAEEYRAAVDRKLFGLGPARHRTLVDLLLTLRRPHLAAKLDPEHVSATLSAGLGEVDSALVDDVAHSFDDLDAMQEELDGLAGALEAVERFLPVYRDHLVGVAHVRADEVVVAHREHRRVGRDRAAAHEERTAASESAVDVGARIEEVEAEQRALGVEIETIQTSSAYQSATALAEVERSADTARRTADTSAKAADQAAQQADRSDRARADAEARRDAATAKAASEVDEWLAIARSAGIERVAEPAGPAMAFDADRATTLVVERRAEVDTVTEAAEQSDGAAAEAERRAATRDDVGRTADEARADRRSADERVALERDDLTERRGAWVAGLEPLLDEIALTADAVDPTALGGAMTQSDVGRGVALDLSDEAELVDPGNPDADGDLAVAERLDRVLADAAHELGRAADWADHEIGIQQERVDHLGAERKRVAEEPNPGPPPNPTRPDASESVDGAPLYVCVDFAPNVALDDRAGLEAALAAAGILDARIRPDDGEVRKLDAVLKATTPTPDSGPTLADVLVPVPTNEVTLERIAEVLAAVSLDGTVVHLGTDGTWRLGPLAGRFTQPAPRYVGHEARERRRSERLAQLGAELVTERSALAALEARRVELDRMGSDLEAARTDQPSTAALRAARVTANEAATIERERAERLVEAKSAAHLAAEGAAHASAELHRQAVALRLPTGLPALADVRRDLVRCDAQIGRVTDAFESQAEASALARDAAENAGSTRRLAAEASATAKRDAEAAKSEGSRYERLRRDVGADAQQAIEDLAAARKRREAAAGRMTELQGALRELEATMARLDERIAQLIVSEERLERDRAEASIRFLPVCSADVADVLEIAGVTPEAEPMDAARAVLAQSYEVPDDATNKMERAYREIMLDGLRAGHDPSMPKLDGFDVIRVGTTDGDVAIGALAARLRADNERLAGLLSTKEREIFETHLLTNVGDVIRRLLLDADRFEQDINDEMAKAPTASGMTVELAWEVDGSEPGLRQAVKSLRYAPEMLGPERREELRTFFTQRIADVRASDPGRSFAETLSVALDYRSWHRFSLFARFADGKRQRVTRTFYRGLSGGEAATLLHLPLFAAAAAQYLGGTVAGPRLIALDEGFAGIDDQMRGRLMGLLTQLDLDVLVTSHEFWGFYEQVPNLVVYDLTRKPPAPGVYAQRFDWTSVPS
jgi:uncharacterized protein (TIGR02680 family)